jgi:hypothetical protein
MRRMLINMLAVVGGLTLLGSLVSFTVHHYVSDGSASGIVLGSGDAPAVGAPVFLNRGNGAIERYVTDSKGRFILPLKEHELYRATWLICVPGGIPMVGRRDREGFQIGPTTYGFTKLTTKAVHIRSAGWLGPMPRECPPARDSIGWRIPVELGKDWYRVSQSEPEWNTPSK